MQVSAKLRHLRISPRKVRLIADQIRGMRAVPAVHQLEVSAKGASLPLMKLLKSAMANAQHNLNLTEESLRIKTITVNEGPTLGRFRPRAFGRAAKIRKRTSHVSLVLTGTPKAKKTKKRAVSPKSTSKSAPKNTVKAVTPARKTSTVKKTSANASSTKSIKSTKTKNA